MSKSRVPELLRLRDACSITGYSKSTILRAVKAGVLVPANNPRQGQGFLFRREDVEAWFTDHAQINRRERE